MHHMLPCPRRSIKVPKWSYMLFGSEFNPGIYFLILAKGVVFSTSPVGPAPTAVAEVFGE